MQIKIRFFLIILLISKITVSSFGSVEETPTIALEKAKFAIEQAQMAGAHEAAQEDLAVANSWLAAAQKEYAKFRSAGTWMTTEKTRRSKEEEIIYLATMAKVRALIAENRVKKEAVSKKLQTHVSELKDNQIKLDSLKKQSAEAEMIKKCSWQIEAERKALAAVKQQLSAMEQQKKLIQAEALTKIREVELLKRKELEEIKMAEAKGKAEIEKELAEAKFKLEKLVKEKTKEEAEKKIISEKLALLQEKITSLERKIEIFIAASKISGSTIKFSAKELRLNILANYLFTPKLELKDQGKEILNQVSNLLNNYPDYQVIVQGHTDNIGNPAANQELSEKRAQKVREYLVAYQNVPLTRITAEGLGPSQPVATNDTEAGRMLNRRVEIVLIIEK